MAKDQKNWVDFVIHYHCIPFRHLCTSWTVQLITADTESSSSHQQSCVPEVSKWHCTSMTLPDAKSIKYVQMSCVGGGGGGGVRWISLYSTAPTTEEVGARELSLGNLQYYRCIVLALMVEESYIRYFGSYRTKQSQEELKSLLFQICLSVFLQRFNFSILFLVLSFRACW
jgi:hypothetical protein